MGCLCTKSSPGGTASVSTEADLKTAIDDKKKICIWMVGGPGCGKGTQCKTLAERFNLAHLSTGDLMREFAAAGKPDSNEIKKTMETGGLIDTSTVLMCLSQKMKDEFPNCKGYLIDGYPREIKQGELFCEKVGSPHLILYLECPDEILTERLLKRGKDSGRVDDNEDTIKNRLVTFHEISQPVMEHWKDKVVIIDGTPTAAEVETDCVQAVENIVKDFQLNN